MGEPPRSQSKPLKEEIKQNSSLIINKISQQENNSLPGRGGANPPDLELNKDMDVLFIEVERFSHLGAELTNLLAELLQKVKDEIEQLRTVRAAVELKKKELERLLKIDVAATALGQLVKDYQDQKERLEIQMANQHRQWEEAAQKIQEQQKYLENLENQRQVWEEEKVQRVKENERYLENLRIQRQHEEEEQTRMRALEQKSAQEKLELEMRTLHRRYMEKQESLEKEWRDRELILKEKEAELLRLVRELESFVANLPDRLKRGDST